jgi:hypothetical protein
MFTHDQFAKIPDSALNEVSAEPKAFELPGSNAEPEQNTPENELFNTGKHTENMGSDTGAASDTSATGGIPKTGKTRLSEMTGGKGGKFAVRLLNYLMPALLIFVVRKLGYEADKKLFELDKDEKEFIEPILDRIIDTIYLDFNNPWVQLSVCLGMVYGVKFMDAANSFRKVEKGGKVTKETSPQDIEDMIRDEFNEAWIKRVEDHASKKRKNADWARQSLMKLGEDKLLMDKIRKKYEKKMQAA